MPTRAALVLLMILGIASAAEARSIPLDQVQQAGVDVEIVSPGGYHQVTLTLRNRSEEPVTVSALPGAILENRNAQQQDLTLSGPVHLSVGPGQSVTRTVGAYCIRADRSIPSAGAHFAPRAIDASLAGMLAERQSAAADGNTQSAVWEFMRHHPTLPTAPVEMNCLGPETGGLRLCVNSQLTRVQDATAITPTPPPAIQIPVVQLPEPAVRPPHEAPVIRRHRPRHRPRAPQAPIGQPGPQIPQPLVIEND